MSKNIKIWIFIIIGVFLYSLVYIFITSNRGVKGVLYIELGKKESLRSILLERLYPPPSIWEISQALRIAKDDDRIKGLFLKLSILDYTWGEIEELRDAVLDFSQKKPSFAYIEYGRDREYYLASGCDTIIIPPLGILWVDGLSLLGMFYKRMWEKIGVDWMVIKAGRYKGAPEIYTKDRFSKETRENLEKILDDIFSVYIKDVSEVRGMRFDSIVDEGPYLVARDAKEKGLVDRIGYLEDILPKNRISVRDYIKRIEGRKIPVVEICGEIRKELAEKVIKRLRRLMDSDYKVVILRIDSPGGDVLSSDLIWREVKKLSQKKHVLVSCGGVCASGGYYIASGGDWITALPMSITGSIGVFTLIPKFEELYKKIGISFDVIKKGRHADFLHPGREMSEYERRKIQGFIEYAYEKFLERVSEGRGISLDSIGKIAEGIVYSGIEASRINLVDTLGGMDVALKKAGNILGEEKVIGYRYGKRWWRFEDIVNLSSHSSILYLLPIRFVID